MNVPIPAQHAHATPRRRIASALMSFLVASAATCHAEVVFQLDATRGVTTTKSNIVWQSVSSKAGSSGTPCFVGESIEWVKTDRSVANVSAEAGPLRLLAEGDEIEEKFVRSLVMVVRCAPELRMRETLACGSQIFRLSGRPENDEFNEVGRIERGGFCQVASWRVDGAAGEAGEVLRSGATQLVEIFFSQDEGLSTLGLLGDTGRKEWRRNWRGEALEMLSFDDVPSGDVMAGVRYYLKLKHGLGAEIPRATPSQIAAARAEGVNMGFYFSTLLILR